MYDSKHFRGEFGLAKPTSDLPNIAEGYFTGFKNDIPVKEQIAKEKELVTALENFRKCGSIQNRKLDYPVFLLNELGAAYYFVQEYQKHNNTSVFNPQGLKEKDLPPICNTKSKEYKQFQQQMKKSSMYKKEGEIVPQIHEIKNPVTRSLLNAAKKAIHDWGDRIHRSADELELMITTNPDIDNDKIAQRILKLIIRETSFWKDYYNMVFDGRNIRNWLDWCNILMDRATNWELRDLETKIKELLSKKKFDRELMSFYKSMSEIVSMEVRSFDIEPEIEEDQSWDAEGRPIRHKKPMSIISKDADPAYVNKVVMDVVMEMVRIIHTHPFKGLMIARKIFGVPLVKRRNKEIGKKISEKRLSKWTDITLDGDDESTFAKTRRSGYA